MLKRIFCGLLGLLALSHTVYAAEDCGTNGQLQAYVNSEKEKELVCAAWSEVNVFYTKSGYAPTTKFSLRFQDHVQFPSEDGKQKFTIMGIFIGNQATIAPTSIPAYQKLLVPFESNTVYMTSYNSPWMRKKTSLGIHYTDDLYKAVLAHEMSHALNKSLYTYNTASSSPGVLDEYLAHVIQLSTLPQAVRDDFLKRYPISKYPAFGHDAEFNPFQYHVAGGADGFAARCWYTHISEKGGKAMFERIYSGDLRPMEMIY